ncbi:hypothetical protein TIFTF001_054352 [Ficus carica]|uniref:Uncharacterized protein n=1 Tax=Ficus carica TaxID=3494 RepID=A0AA88JIF4_FICCA|nr:hypothetical protein TIFTF001_054351 [Ficus carica]GMN73731.1 hypothetical protein TIFTF001_054352 [Ficus carica]
MGPYESANSGCGSNSSGSSLSSLGKPANDIDWLLAGAGYKSAPPTCDTSISALNVSRPPWPSTPPPSTSPSSPPTASTTTPPTRVGEQ